MRKIQTDGTDGDGGSRKVGERQGDLYQNLGTVQEGEPEALSRVGQPPLEKRHLGSVKRNHGTRLHARVAAMCFSERLTGVMDVGGPARRNICKAPENRTRPAGSPAVGHGQS